VQKRNGELCPRSLTLAQLLGLEARQILPASVIPAEITAGVAWQMGRCPMDTSTILDKLSIIDRGRVGRSEFRSLNRRLHSPLLDHPTLLLSAHRTPHVLFYSDELVVIPND
jgi:hypothetical protein